MVIAALNKNTLLAGGHWINYSEDEMRCPLFAVVPEYCKTLRCKESTSLSYIYLFVYI